MLTVQGVVHHWELPALSQLGQVMEDRHPSVPQNKPAGYIIGFPFLTKGIKFSLH